MFTREDGRQMMDVLEGIATTCKKIDEDHAASISWLQRVQAELERQEQEIVRIKTALKLT